MTRRESEQRRIGLLDRRRTLLAEMMGAVNHNDKSDDGWKMLPIAIVFGAAATVIHNILVRE